MKRIMIALGILLLLGALAVAADKQQPQAPGSEAPKPPPRKFVIHLKNGGSIDTNNYTIEGNRLRVELPTGRVYIDRSLVKNVEEVKGIEETPVQTIPVGPAPGVGGPPKGAPKLPARPPSTYKEKLGPTDDDGHDEAWWKKRVDTWKKRREDALIRYKKAEEQWNTYNGLLTTVNAGTLSQYEVTKYQDLRGAGRVDMDKAQADIDEADKMLNETLPDEARKANAPPGWAR